MRHEIEHVFYGHLDTEGGDMVEQEQRGESPGSELLRGIKDLFLVRIKNKK